MPQICLESTSVFIAIVRPSELTIQWCTIYEVFQQSVSKKSENSQLRYAEKFGSNAATESHQQPLSFGTIFLQA